MSQQALDADKVLTHIAEQVKKLEKVHSEREQVEMVCEKHDHGIPFKLRNFFNELLWIIYYFIPS